MALVKPVGVLALEARVQAEVGHASLNCILLRVCQQLRADAPAAQLRRYGKAVDIHVQHGRAHRHELQQIDKPDDVALQHGHKSPVVVVQLLLRVIWPDVLLCNEMVAQSVPERQHGGVVALFDFADCDVHGPPVKSPSIDT